MSGKDEERTKRLAAALRDNLRRRKAQARELKQSLPEDARDRESDRNDPS